MRKRRRVSLDNELIGDHKRWARNRIAPPSVPLTRRSQDARPGVVTLTERRGMIFGLIRLEGASFVESASPSYKAHR
jgi:hypothetical protein